MTHRTPPAVESLESKALLGDNGRVIALTEPQVWVLIGVFAAAIFGMVGIVTASFNRNLDSKFLMLDGKVDSRFDALDVKFTAKFELMDRDIQALSRHVFGSDAT